MERIKHADTKGRRRIAVVGLFDSEERDKLALIVHGIQRAGHAPILVDAELFAAGRCRLDRVTSGAALVVGHGSARIGVAEEIRGRHRRLDGSPGWVAVRGITTVTADAGGRPVDGPIPVDAVWPDALDITRRLEFEGLYRQLAEHRIPSLAGSWESVLNATFKHRTRQVLGPDLPQPRSAIVTADLADPEIERVRDLVDPGDVWVKAPNDSHSRGIFWLPAGAHVAGAAREAMRDTPDGRLCLIEADVCGVVADETGRRYRADLTVTVLDGRAVHAALRVQPTAGAPTNSLHGGRSMAVAPADLPAEVRRIAIAAVVATGSRYGSADIFGGLSAGTAFTAVRLLPPVVGEVNKMPGGRSPGFLARVIGPLVSAYVSGHAGEWRDR